MRDTSSKKQIILNILEVLKENSDEYHKLSQKDISELLKSTYQMSVDRKTIKRNLTELLNLGYPIEYSEQKRQTRDKATGELTDTESMTDFYLVREISDAELRLLIDGLLFSRHIPYTHCRDLVKKLERMSNKYFRFKMRHIHAMPQDKTDNKQVFYNISVLDEAIEKHRKVAFKYLDYGIDKKQRAKRGMDGSERIYVISPYQMAANKDKYYLICNNDKFDDISHFRIDRIADIELLDEKARPFETLEWSNAKKLDLAEYMRQHIYMYSSANTSVKFRIVRAMVSDVIDELGSDVRFYNETPDTVCVSASVNERSMIQFAKSFAPDVEVLSPKRLRDSVRDEIRKGLAAYDPT